MKPAPAFDCANCGRHIGKTRTHYLIAGAVWCVRCVDRADRYDDVTTAGTRAGVANLLGLWP